MPFRRGGKSYWEPDKSTLFRARTPSTLVWACSPTWDSVNIDWKAPYSGSLICYFEGGGSCFSTYLQYHNPTIGIQKNSLPPMTKKWHHDHGRLSSAIRCKCGRSYHQYCIHRCHWSLQLLYAWLNRRNKSNMGQFMPTSRHFTSAAGIVEHVTTAKIIWGDATRHEWMFYIISIIVVVGGWVGSVYLLPFWPPMLIFYILCSHDTTCLFYLAITSQYIMVDLRQWMRRVFTGILRYELSGWLLGYWSLSNADHR